MATLQETLANKIPVWREEIANVKKQYGDKVVSQVTLNQAYGGMRGVKGMVCDTSVVEPDKGLIIRGHPLLEIKHLWPEEIFFLLLPGEMPDAKAKAAFQQDLDKRAQVPEYVWDVLQAMPSDSHPMCMLNTAVLVMERESVFRQWYDKRMTKQEYWVPALEDALTVMARMPGVAVGTRSAPDSPTPG